MFSKRFISLLLAVLMVASLFPVYAFAASKTFDEFFEGLPLIAETEPGSPNSTKKWDVATLNGEDVLKSGNAGKSNSSSVLQLTMTGDAALTFEYKVSTEAKYDKVNITKGSETLVKDASGEVDWTTLVVDAKSGDVITITYKKDPSGDKGDDCVYVRNFSAGTPLTLTLHANNGTDETVTQSIYGGKGNIKANTFTCEGKVFAGWALSAEGEAVYADGGTIEMDTDTDLYAVWSGAFTVTFDYNDGKTAAKTVQVPQNAAIGSAIPSNPTRKGYTFAGWFNGESQLSAETIISADVTYTAKWEPITYTISFNRNGGEGSMDNITATYDEEVVLPLNTFTRAGYDFIGWGTSSSYVAYKAGETVKNLADSAYKTVTLYAVWRGKAVAVTVDPNYPGAEVIHRTGAVGSNYNYIITESGTVKFSSIADPVRTGYIFQGWFDAAEGGNEISVSYKFDADDAANGVTMYAHWQKGITVHFDGNGYKSSINDKTVALDAVYKNLPYLTKSYYPANKALDGWYVKNADGSFGEKVTESTVFSGDEVTLIAKWRDYQYIIKFNIKYSDKSSVTGTMPDQAAFFGVDTVLNKCAYSRPGYDFKGWATSSYGSTVDYADGATINRPFEEGDYWDDGSEDGESFNLYAVWEEALSDEERAARQKLDAAEKAISGTFNPKYGVDTNALTMINAKLAAAGITDVTVSMKNAEYSSYNHVGIAADGTLQYKWNENGSTSSAPGSVRPTVVLTYGKYTKESTGCLFSMGLDEAKALAALNRLASRVSVPGSVNDSTTITSLPQYILKEGVDESNVDYNKSDDIELWATANWQSSNTAVISVNKDNSKLFAPYKVTVTRPSSGIAKVTLTLTITYNGREDLKVTKAYNVNVFPEIVVKEVDYQKVLEEALKTLKNPRNGEAIDPKAVASDIQFPTTRDIEKITLRDYNEYFDGKYTPVLITSSNENVIVSTGTYNVARARTYRPLPGSDNADVTVTVYILDRPSGTGNAVGKPLAKVELHFTVLAFSQKELDDAAAFMKKVCTEEVYWQGIKKANSAKDNVTGDMWSFIEIVPDGDGYKFIRNMNDYNFNGVEADDIDGWEAAEKYRCFRSSVPSVVQSENLLVTKPEYDTKVKIDSVLSYTEYAKYYEKFKDDPNYAQFAQFYKQPIFTVVTVKGEKGANPSTKEISVTVNVTGSTFEASFADLSKLYTCMNDEYKTAANAVFSVLEANGYTVSGSESYVTGITDKNGVALSSGDENHGPWSGWMFKVNGAAPMLDSTTYARLDQYILKENDVITFYYVDCPTDDGNHIPSASDPAVCSVCGGHIPAVTTTYVWNNNNSECTATATRNGVVTATETAKSTMTVVKAATCTEKGQVKFTVEFKNAAFSKQEKTIDTDPLNHDWNAPTYDWKEVQDGYECTAKRVCKHDASHVETDKATVTYAEITPATCLVNGEGRYTARFNAAWAETQTKDVVLNAFGHDWNAPTYEWKEAQGGYECTAKRVCKHNASHVETDKATVTYAEITPATCLANGEGRYTAKFNANWAETQTKDVVLNAFGHDWNPPTYEWKEVQGGYECSAKRVCKHDASHVETDKATVTYAEITPATCLVNGEGRYTAKFGAAWAEAQTKDVVLNAFGHDWNAPTYEWKEVQGGYECTAKRVCKNDASHVETDKATVTYAEITPATCLANGEGRYTAKFGAAWAETQTKDVVLTKLDHSHNGRWIYNREQHWQKCVHCGELTNVGAHTFTEWKDILRDGKVVSEHHCTVCGFSECAQIIHIDGTKKTQPGVEVNPATGAAVPAVLPAIAVLAGAAVLLGKKK